MTGHQRWFVNKFQKYNLANDLEVMDQIKKSEKKEALRTQPGWSKESYQGIMTRARNLDVTESVDRRLLFELMGKKINPDGTLKENENVKKKVEKIVDDDDRVNISLTSESVRLLQSYSKVDQTRRSGIQDTSSSNSDVT